MNTKMLKLAVAGAMLLAVALACAPQETGSAGVNPVEADKSAANSVEANKKVVHDFYRFVWEPRSLQAFEEYTSPDYVEHNPMFPGPRENILNFLKTGRFGDWTKPAPVRDTLEDPPALIVAEGDLVQWVFKRTGKDPRDASKTFDYFWYDTFRVKDGKIVEHWDNAMLNAPAAP
jgi:predicted SnoaL-like aldol condensation-catalyzing enzyme